MSDDAIHVKARRVLDACRTHGLKLVIAESCTAGLVAGALTEIPGASDVVERGFVTYSNESKSEMLGVPAAMIAEHGAVSEPVARAMAEGALARAASRAGVSIAVTGVAGPGSDSRTKPAGLVHFAAARVGKGALHEKREFGDIGRHAVRRAAVEAALDLILRRLGEG
ncbi:MAG: CinA family protein [Alphaproteobacteria bacterium]